MATKTRTNNNPTRIECKLCDSRVSFETDARSSALSKLRTHQWAEHPERYANTGKNLEGARGRAKKTATGRPRGPGRGGSRRESLAQPTVEEAINALMIEKESYDKAFHAVLSRLRGMIGGGSR